MTRDPPSLIVLPMLVVERGEPSMVYMVERLGFRRRWAGEPEELLAELLYVGRSIQEACRTYILAEPEGLVFLTDILGRDITPDLRGVFDDRHGA